MNLEHLLGHSIWSHNEYRTHKIDKKLPLIFMMMTKYYNKLINFN